MDFRKDIPSKVIDGLLPTVALYLLTFVVSMPVALIRHYFDGPGLLVYLSALIAIAMFSLHRALLWRASEPARAFYGMAGGLLAWGSVEVGLALDQRPLMGFTLAGMLVMGILMTMLFWRPHLPLGGQFFAVTLLCFGAERLVVTYLLSLATGSEGLAAVFRIAGFGLGAAALGVLGWMAAFSDRRITRMWSALAAVLLAVLSFYLTML